MSQGIIIKISGPVLDVRFPAGAEPRINTLLVTDNSEENKLGDAHNRIACVHMEVAAHVSPEVVRCVALEATYGLCCGTAVTDTEIGRAHV